MPVELIFIIIGLVMMGWGGGELYQHYKRPTNGRPGSPKQSDLVLVILGLVVTACATAASLLPTP
jgi:hypothetical protein